MKIEIYKQKLRKEIASENTRLFVFDVGGIIRYTAKLDNESFKFGFNQSNLEYKFNAETVWHLKGLGKYKNRKKCIKALLAISDIKQENNLINILKQENAEEKVDYLIENLIETKGIETIDRNVQKIYDEYGSYFNSVKGAELVETIPNSKEAIELIKSKNYKIAIFSNSGLNSIERDVSYYKIFNAVISKEDVTKEKPSGEGIIKAAEKLNINIKNVVYVGDAEVDVDAARDAGCKSLIICNKYSMSSSEQIMRKKPDLVFKDIYKFAKDLINKNTQNKKSEDKNIRSRCIEV